ncbi:MULTISPECIES: SusC/RagA family TonB-linked outer membrane protein [Mesonia]|uniref:TonB-dependent receptor SusC n=1 Tax=Mesonia oceanica TaxID=2687242 RepID=A0AC61YAH8_9FLAO|nr:MULTISPECIES: SusC/RagA family TonB-linked outer membrane protein [Mesonia]VVV01507.1 TonB-dependent receptor SusC [Mesonia oceanica]|tara:strand:+ start:2908 stop:6057 length:3150 start_codon:yes stop_codon:yes gene_type:complete
MRTKFSGILTLLLAFVVQITFAQEKTVTGMVTDGDGLPLPGVNIIVQGTSSGTQTDFDGNYSIEVSNGDVLEFSYVGFETQEVTIGGQSSYNVSLEAGNQLEEVIVTAAGIEREKSSIGAATATIQAEEIVKGAQSDIANSLKGKVAGVTIASASTDPGASSGVIIRGVSTLSGSNQPLYVIDGVPMNNQSAFDDDLNGGYDFGRGSQDVNPEDIENITILKGASATALYGNRGANGVVVITTKKGKAGKLTVDLSTTTFFSRVNRTPNRQETFGQGWDAVHYLGENGSWGPRFDGKTRVWGNIVNNSQQLKPYSFQEDQMRNFFTTGTSYLNSVAVSGGNEKSTARMSYSNLSQDGIYPTDADSFERNNLSLSADSKVGFLNFSGNLNYVNTSGSSVAAGQGLTVFNNILQTPTDINISGFKDYNDPFNNVSNYFTPYGVTNPYFTLNENGSKYNKERVYGSFTLDLDINSWSNLTYRFGLDTYSSQLRKWEAIVDAAPGSPNDGTSTEYPGSYYENQLTYKQLNHDILYDLNLDINESIGVVSTSGFNINIRESNSLTAEVGSQNIPGFYSLSNSGQQPQASSLRSTRKLYGIFNTTTFDLKNQLFLTGNIRNDWYSTLPLGNNSILYGGVNTSWVFTRTFDGLTSFMNYGKLRAGYGSTGVDTSPYLVNSVFVPGSADNQGFANLNFPLGGVNAYEVGNRAANSNLKPETRKEFEVGAELEFFSNRLGIDFTYYDSKVENQILALPFAPSTGYTSQQANVGTISNKGIEALVTITPIKTNNFTWRASINFATNNSKLEELDDRIDQVSLAGLSTTSLLAREGQTIGLIEGSVPARTDSGQIIVDSNGVPIAASEKEVYGDTQYDYTLGFSNNLSYKNLSLDFTLDSRQGGLMFSRTASIMRFTGNSTVTMYNDRRPFVVSNSVQQVLNDDGSITYVENSTPVDREHQDDYYRAEALNRGEVIDKSFVKLREVVISYSIPSKLLDKTFMDALSFSVIGRNLFVWTPEDNQFIDPEVSTFGTGLSGQFGEFGANPSTRSVGFSIKTKF